MSRFLLKPSARKKKDHVFKVFHELNLKDAMNYVEEVRVFLFLFFEVRALQKVAKFLIWPACFRVSAEAPWSLFAMKRQWSTSRRSLASNTRKSCPT